MVNLEKFENMLVEAESVRKGMVDYLYEHRNEFDLVEVTQYCVKYCFKDFYIEVWIANGEDHCRFYETLSGIELDSLECYTPEMRKELWGMTREAIAQNGERRRIEKTQMRNDMYFKFKGVHSDVKFSGYDDSNWWTNHKPVEVEEDESITWTIDWEKMEAVYKPKK